MVKAPRNVSEKYLLDALSRIAKNPSGYSVLYVNVSKLKPKNRHPEFIKIFAKLFDGIVGATNGMMFILTNSDFVILGKKISTDTVDLAVKKLRQGLSSDPILYSQNSAEFAEVYNFPDDFPTFYQQIEKRIQTNLEEEEIILPQKHPIGAGQIDDVIAHLDNIDIAELVKHQSILRIKGPGKFEVLFQEFFVAVKDLSLQFDKNIDLVANKWLFSYLTQTLDKKTISAFDSAEIANWPQQISLNLNISSVFSREFINFSQNFLKPEQKIVVEVQLMDAFNNLNMYFEAREALHQNGHKILIDAMNPLSLRMLNIKRLEPDMIKIFWEPLLEDDTNNEEFKADIESMGKENVILAKCDNEKALRWGVSYGITTFQGPYIDNLEVAMLRSKCPDINKCSVQQCLKRRRLLSGAFRDECTQKKCLEDLLG